MSRRLSGGAAVAGVVGAPVDHSLSPAIHGAWIEAAGLDAVYAPFAPAPVGFERLIEGLRGGVIRGLNVTAPFKERALAAATVASPFARRAGAANLLLFDKDGAIRADNTDGVGLLAAFAEQAPSFRPRGARVAILGAGGAARGAAAALLDAGAEAVRVINRTPERGAALAALFGPRVTAWALTDHAAALAGCEAVVNASSAAMAGDGGPAIDLSTLERGAAVMDMVYRPVRTALLIRAEAAGFAPVDGLAMLIGQAAPSFEALFGVAPPEIDVRAVVPSALET